VPGRTTGHPRASRTVATAGGRLWSSHAWKIRPDWGISRAREMLGAPSGERGMRGSPSRVPRSSTWWARNCHRAGNQEAGGCGGPCAGHQVTGVEGWDVQVGGRAKRRVRAVMAGSSRTRLGNRPVWEAEECVGPGTWQGTQDVGERTEIYWGWKDLGSGRTVGTLNRRNRGTPDWWG